LCHPDVPKRIALDDREIGDLAGFDAAVILVLLGLCGILVETRSGAAPLANTVRTLYSGSMPVHIPSMSDEGFYDSHTGMPGVTLDYVKDGSLVSPEVLDGSAE
jgi:hypothetical protein